MGLVRRALNTRISSAVNIGIFSVRSPGIPKRLQATHSPCTHAPFMTVWERFDTYAARFPDDVNGMVQVCESAFWQYNIIDRRKTNEETRAGYMMALVEKRLVDVGGGKHAYV